MLITRPAAVAASQPPSTAGGGGTRHNPHAKAKKAMSEDNGDFTALDDAALIDLRTQMRAELERLAPHSPDHAELSARYDQSTLEIDDRARRAWAAARKGGPTP